MRTTELIEGIEANNRILKKILLVSDLATHLRLAILRISERLSEDAPDIANELRLAGLRFNTSLAFPDIKLLKVCGFDNFENTHKTWGEDIAIYSKVLSQTVSFMESNGSFLQSQFLKIIKTEMEETCLKNIKIWCHSRERTFYLEFLARHGIGLSNESFICSLTDYRQVDSFAVLIFVGPLRNIGWSCIPRVVISAPRYRKMIQLVWRGLADSPEFGCDPIITEKNYLVTLFDRTEQVVTETSIFEMQDSSITSEDEKIFDDLEIYDRKSKDVRDTTDCYLIKIGSEQGLLLSQGSGNIVFEDNGGIDPFKVIKSKEIESRQFLVLHDVKVDLGTYDTAGAKLAVLWKNALDEMYRFQWETLISKMRQGGITLKNLDHAASHWKTIDESTIHAPQSREHFRILIEKVLPFGCLDGSTWQQAWLEIESIRTRARQDGRIMAEIINEELVKQLNKDAFELEFNASPNLADFIVYEIGKREGTLIGTIKLFRVFEAISGFRASYEKLNIIDNIDKFELYRMES